MSKDPSPSRSRFRLSTRHLAIFVLAVCFCLFWQPEHTHAASLAHVADRPSLASTVYSHRLEVRQQPTNTTGPVQGGADSAEHAAEAAGNSIDTGSGGERSTPTSPQGFAQLLSGVFFGGLLTLIAGGAFVVQAWHYFERFGKRGSDQRAVQVAVGVMCVFSLLQDCVIIHRLYEIHVAKFGDFAFPLLTVGWEISVSWICIAINTGLAHLYYAHRVWLAFRKNMAIMVVYAILIAYTFCGGIASAIMIIKAGSAANVKGQALHSFQPNSIPWQFSVVFATWLCSSAAIDISLCVSLVWQLKKMETPFFHTRHAVARLLLLSVETCLGTTTLSIAAMILFLAVPYQFYFQIPFLPIGQIMCCSLLVTLMTRPSIARELACDQGGWTLQGNLEDASSAAPTSLAKPVVKRLMRKENAKRPKGDGTGVRMTMTREVESDEAVAPYAAFGSDGEEKIRDTGDAATLYPSQKSSEDNFKSKRDSGLDAGVWPTPASPTLPASQAPMPFADGHPINDVVGGVQGTNLHHLAARSNAAGVRKDSSPTQPRPVRRNGLQIAIPTGHQGVPTQGYGRTPRGRRVPIPETLSAPASSRTLAEQHRAYESGPRQEDDEL